MENPEHPARPEQTDDQGFEQGYDQARDTPEEQREPNFARGIAKEPAPGTERHGHFSDGEEQIPDQPDTPADHVERRFSEGIERSPTSD